MPDLHLTIEEMVAEGDKVVWRLTGTGPHRGDFMGIPATQRSITVPGIVITRFEGGKWAEDFALWDQLGMLQQLGVIPTPEQAEV
jgi:predicted ester cyclase